MGVECVAGTASVNGAMSNVMGAGTSSVVTTAGQDFSFLFNKGFGLVKAVPRVLSPLLTREAVAAGATLSVPGLAVAQEAREVAFIHPTTALIGLGAGAVVLAGVGGYRIATRVATAMYRKVARLQSLKIPVRDEEIWYSRFADRSKADFCGDDLQGQARLLPKDCSGIPFDGAIVDKGVAETILQRGGNLNGVRLVGDFRNANLRDADLELANLEQADLFRASLVAANLQGASLRGVKSSDLILEKADLRGADLRGVSLRGVILEDAFLQGSDLFQEAKFSFTRLVSTKLQGANLQNADFTGADFLEADLREADLSRACLVGAKFIGSNLLGAQLPENCFGIVFTNVLVTQEQKTWIEEHGGTITLAQIRAVG